MIRSTKRYIFQLFIFLRHMFLICYPNLQGEKMIAGYVIFDLCSGDH